MLQIKQIFFGNYGKHFSPKKISDININLLLKLKEANIFNSFLVNIVKSLNIPAWNPENSRNNTDLKKILETFESHPSLGI